MKGKSSFQYQDQSDPAKGKGSKPMPKARPGKKTTKK